MPNGMVGKAPSRNGDDVISGRMVNTARTANLTYGDPVVLLSTGQVQSVADFIAGGGTFTASLFAGIAVGEFHLSLSLGATTSTNPAVGQYVPGQMAGVLRRGNAIVQVNNGTPTPGAPVYIRISTSASVPAGVVGQFEATSDSSHTVELTNVVFYTGEDTTGAAEVTILSAINA